MKFRSLAGAVVLLSCMAADAAEPLVFELKHSSPRDMKAVLDSMSKQAGNPALEVTVDGRRVLVQGADEKMRERLSKLVAEFDAPQIPVFTRFIKLSHTSPEKVVEFLNKALAVQPAAAARGVQRIAADTADEVKDDGKSKPEKVPIQLVPATLTNEVFVLGHAEDIKLVESLLRVIDTDPPPVFK
jgi:type II secretory pathway component GspD/PulD (secretin)